jgi:hypothetical protein
MHVVLGQERGLLADRGVGCCAEVWYRLQSIVLRSVVGRGKEFGTAGKAQGKRDSAERDRMTD